MLDAANSAPRFNVITGSEFYLPILKFLKTLPNDYVGTVMDIQKYHGPLVHVSAFGGAMNMAFISDANVNRELFVRNTDALGKSPSQIQTFLYAAGNSVATAHGEDWRVKRKEANNLFSRSIVEASCAGQVQVVQDYVAALPAQPHDAMTLARHMAAVTSSRGILGRSISIDEANTQIAFSTAAGARFNAESAHMFARPHWMLAPWRRELTKQRNKVFPIVQASIDELRASNAPNDGLMNHYVNGDFITSNDAEMLTILVGLLMGAQDNIASATGWVLAYLAHYPAVQDQIRSEIKNVGSNATDLGDCPILNATIQEILRLRPPAQANQPRILRKSVDIAGHHLPKGCFVLNSIYNMHHDPVAFVNPDTFDPTRFIGNDLARAPNYAPFGHGPRNCVAQGMAMQQLRAIVVGMLRYHKLTPLDAAFPTMNQTPFLVPAPFKVAIAKA